MFSDLLKPETFDFLARYLLAGYIIMIVRSRFVVGERPKTTELVAEAVVLSLINQFVFQLIEWPLPENWLGSLDKETAFFSEVLILPAALGLILGANLSRGWNNAILRRLSMPITQPAQRAHDFAFSHQRRAGMVIVTYFDGASVHGYFGENSLASRDTERSDIFLERLYDINDEGQWSELSPPRGALLSLSNVRSIEFLDEEGDAQ